MPVTLTALLILLTAFAIAAHITAALRRLLISRRSLPARLVVLTVGLGYGLTEPLRGSALGLVLTLLGACAAGSFASEVERRARVRFPAGNSSAVPIRNEAPAAATGANFGRTWDGSMSSGGCRRRGRFS